MSVHTHFRVPDIVSNNVRARGTLSWPCSTDRIVSVGMHFLPRRQRRRTVTAMFPVMDGPKKPVSQPVSTESKGRGFFFLLTGL